MSNLEGWICSLELETEFKKIPEGLTFDGAIAACAEEDAFVAPIFNLDEYNFVKDFVLNNEVQDHWIGMLIFASLICST